MDSSAILCKTALNDHTTFSLLRCGVANIRPNSDDAEDHDSDGVHGRISHGGHILNQNDWIGEHAADWQGLAASGGDCAWEDYLRREGFAFL